MSWDVHIISQAEKDIQKLKLEKEDFQKLMGEIAKLHGNPRLGGVLEGKLKEARSLTIRLKQRREYRAAYVILPEEKACIVFIVGPRERFYEKANRRALALGRRPSLITYGRR